MDGQQELTACVDQSYTHPQGNYTIYRLVVRIFKDKTLEKIVYKRFSDFLHLHHELRRVHSALACNDVFPILPKSYRTNRFDPTVVEERRIALDNFVKFIASNPNLYCHTHFTRFVVAAFSNRVVPVTESVCIKETGDFKISYSSSPSSSFNSLNSLASTSAPIESPLQSRLIEPNSCSINSSNSKYFDHFQSPISSDSDEELNGDSLSLIWEVSAHRESKIATGIQSAKDFILKRRWADAFRCYKDVISLLLKEMNSTKLEPLRKDDYQCLLSACLAKTEFIHREFLANSKGVERTSREGNNPSRSWMESPTLSSLCKDAALSLMFGSVEELTKLKICGIEGMDLVVCSRNDDSVRYTLKSRSLPILTDTKSSSVPLISSAKIDPSLIHCRHILPVGQVPFMRRLLRLVETPDHRRVFLLVERTRGELRLVDWLGAYLESRISSLIGGKLSRDAEARRHLEWCEARSNRIRRVAGKKEKADSRNFEDFGTRYHSVPTPLLTPSAIFAKYPPYLSCGGRSRSRSLIGYPKSIPARLSEDEATSKSQKFVPLLPERQCIHWAAELISVVTWLHSRHITLGNFNRSSIYLTQSGDIEVDYFFRWETGHETTAQSANAAPELLIGPQARTFFSPAACDWWSVGVVLFEIFVGLQLNEAHPDGLWAGRKLELPPTLSVEVADLLNLLLKINPNDRISDSDIKNHAAFRNIDWSRLSEVIPIES